MNRLIFIFFAGLSCTNVFASQNNASSSHETFTMQEFSCDQCEGVFKSKRGLSTHVARNHTVPKVPCVLCPTVCTSQCALRTHRHRFHKEAAIVGKNSTYRKKNITNDGLKKQEKVSKPSFACDECSDKFFYNKASLRRHKSTQHGVIPGALEPGEKVYCLEPGCDKAGIPYSKKGLKSHEKFHKNPTVQCPTCNTWYRSEKSFLNHRPGCNGSPSGLLTQTSLLSHSQSHVNEIALAQQIANESLSIANASYLLPVPDVDTRHLLEIAGDKIFGKKGLDLTDLDRFLKN